MHRKYWVGLSLIFGIGPVRIKRLLDYFHSPDKIWSAPKKELLKVPLLGPKLVTSMIKARREIDLDAYLQQCKQAEIEIATFEDSQYPAKLKEIYDPPPVLYYRGRLVESDQLSIAVVGTRKMTPYGARIVRKLVPELVKAGLTIVSGLALGIDGLAHQITIETGGRTLAVLGSGLDQIYPPEHQNLYQAIIKNGAVISTFPPTTPPEKSNFPARNRIISGLSEGTLVVEAGQRSGALITADQALEQNRQVFAVPGNIFYPLSQGTNELLQKGAKLVVSTRDILEELGIYITDDYRDIDQKIRLTNTEKRIVQLLEREELSSDQLFAKMDLSIQELNALLLELELKGLIVQYPGQRFALS